MEAIDIEYYDVTLDCPEKTVPRYKTLTCGIDFFSYMLFVVSSKFYSLLTCSVVLFSWMFGGNVL